MKNQTATAIGRGMTWVAARAMKTPRLPALLVFGMALWVAGCGSIETSPGGDPNRVLEGVVTFPGSVPAGAEILVRVVEPPSSEPARTLASDMPVAAQPSVARVERVLGEAKQIVAEMTTKPVPFRVEYQADDAVLRRGVNIDVRVSVGGKVRMRTVNAHALTLRSAPFKQDVAVQSVQ